jgi:hypothetical protein
MADQPIDSWLGGCFVAAESEGMALMKVNMLCMNPGGEALFVGPLAPESVKPSHMNRLLSYEEVEESKADDLPEMQ